MFNKPSPAINHIPFNPPACQCVYEDYSCLVVVNVHFVHILTHVDVIRALTHQLDAEWRKFGTFLHVEPAIMDWIEKDRTNVGARMLQLVEDWVCHKDGTGDLPRTWMTVVQAVKDMGAGALAQQLTKQYIR